MSGLILNKTKASILLFGYEDIGRLNKWIRLTNEKGQKKFPLKEIFLPDRKEPVILKSDIDKTIDVLSSQ